MTFPRQEYKTSFAEDLPYATLDYQRVSHIVLSTIFPQICMYMPPVGYGFEYSPKW